MKIIPPVLAGTRIGLEEAHEHKVVA